MRALTRLMTKKRKSSWVFSLRVENKIVAELEEEEAKKLFDPYTPTKWLVLLSWCTSYWATFLRSQYGFLLLFFETGRFNIGPLHVHNSVVVLLVLSNLPRGLRYKACWLLTDGHDNSSHFYFSLSSLLSNSANIYFFMVPISNHFF